MAAKKPNDKLSKIDKRIASVAPGKKYSDMTPEEKRKYDTNQARWNAALSKQSKTPTKSSKETIAAAKKKTPSSKGVTSSKLPPKLVEQLKADIKARQKAKPSTAKVPVKTRGGRGGLGGLNINSLKK